LCLPAPEAVRNSVTRVWNERVLKAGTIRISAILVLGLVIQVDVLTAQERNDEVRGRITTDSGVPIAGADVFVTIAPSAQTLRAVSDSSGLYSLAISGGTGEYLFYAGALGRKPFRRRLTGQGRDTVFTVDVQLGSATVVLNAVRVEGVKARPIRTLGGDPLEAGTNSIDKTVDGVFGALPPNLQGNLTAIAALVPGLTLRPDGYSALGVGSGQNQTTLNGLSVPSGDLPRRAQAKTRFSTSPWDPSLGGFSGVLSSVMLSKGQNISERSGEIAIDAPQLQFSDPAAKRLGQKFTNLDFSGSGSGALALDRLFYTYAAQLTRRSTFANSLLDLDPTALRTTGVAVDSASRLLRMLDTLGVELHRNDIPLHETVATTASFLARVDHDSRGTGDNGESGPAWWFSGYGSFRSSSAVAISPLVPPTSGGRGTDAIVGLQGLYSKYLGSRRNYLNETSSGLSLTAERSIPYLNIPSANVLVASDDGTGNAALGSLRFGSGALAYDRRTWSWEVVNQTAFLWHHRSDFPLKLSLRSRLDGFQRREGANRLGTYNFSSLSAVATNTPSSFSRTLDAPRTTGGQWLGTASLGGEWTRSQLTLMGGVRIDGNVFTGMPAQNPRVAQLFGHPTNHAPNGFGVSPRLGFTWRYTGSRGFTANGNPVSSVNRGGTQLRGGIGRFRSQLPSTLLSNAIVSTGLAGATRNLLCVGPATPVPDWNAYARDASLIPAECMGPSALIDSGVGVRLFDRSYAPPESWRAALGWTSTIGGMHVAVDGVYSLNLHQPSSVDLNFTGRDRFTLADEGRPVFVPSASIDPRTGLVSVSGGRVSPMFGRVVKSVSDLRGAARQLTAYAIPNLPDRFGLVTLAYTYAEAKAQVRGFDQTTGRDPRAVEWAPDPYTPRHSVLLQAARVFSKFGITTSIRAVSGSRYTPMVAGDINGDGLSNDRAFVFDPSAVGDTAVSRRLSALLGSGPSRVRDCLQRQIGRIAEPNSCVAPWSTTTNATVYFFPALPGTGGRTQVSLSLSNPIGGLDLLLHGANHLHGWGTSPLPDPVLYRVRAFDTSTSRFRYEVNPRFGSASPATSVFRNPFRVTLDVRIDLGRPYAEQQLDQGLRIRPSMRGTRAPADSIKKRYMEQNFTDVFGYLLSISDSLALSQHQIEQMEKEREALNARADAIYGELASYLAALPNAYDRQLALKHISDADERAWDAIYAERGFIKQLLTPGQIRLLPSDVYQMVTVANYRRRFFFGGF
jgi:hypothetical protein